MERGEGILILCLPSPQKESGNLCRLPSDCRLICSSHRGVTKALVRSGTVQGLYPLECLPEWPNPLNPLVPMAMVVWASHVTYGTTASINDSILRRHLHHPSRAEVPKLWHCNTPAREALLWHLPPLAMWSTRSCFCLCPCPATTYPGSQTV